MTKFSALPLLIVGLSLVLASSIFAADAQAKRLGGGRSLGTQRSSLSTRPQTAPPVATRPPAAANPATLQPRTANRWGGLLGGLAAGIGLAALFHALGLGPAGASIITALLIAGLTAWVLMMLLRFSRRSATLRQPHPAAIPLGAYDAGQLGQESYQSVQRFEGMNPTSSDPARSYAGIPDSFDQRAFLNKAREHYYLLQQAWDAGDLPRIESYTTSEMFAQLRNEIEQRGAIPNKTDVVTLEAVLLDLHESDGQYLASVEFSGLVREESWGGAQPVREIWNLVKPTTGASGWLLAGIQQLA
ncbi:MAG: Tim44 domain-containing protein [Betaproteobacteria bacterium]|nr:Tim44 domain-containing protein [Betaproteobacteria bacterium]